MMDKSCSNCDSILSLDSLECENTNISKSQSAHKNNILVPHYSGEDLLQDKGHVKHEEKTQPKSLSSRIPTIRYKVPSKSHSIYTNLSSEVKSNQSQSSIPSHTYFDDEKLYSSTTNVKRISRRTVFTDDQTIRPRHKSVSYVEQFRKKVFSSEKLKTLTLSIADAKVYQSTSLESWENRDSGLGTSEFEFYDDIVLQHQSTKIGLNSSQLNESEKLVSENRRKTPMEIEGKTVLKRVHRSCSEISTNKVDEKKSSVERREEYATKVKMRNQLNFNLKRERDKERIFKGNCNTETNYKDKAGKNKNPPNISAIPFTSPLDVFRNKNKPNSPMAKKRGRKSGQLKKKVPVKDEEINIAMLRKRHEQEKQLVNSLRKLIVKS